MKCFISQVVIFLVIVSSSCSKDLSQNHWDALSQKEVVGLRKRSVESRSEAKHWENVLVFIKWFLSFSSAVGLDRIWQTTLLRNVPLMSQLTSKVYLIHDHMICIYCNIIHSIRYIHIHLDDSTAVLLFPFLSARCPEAGQFSLKMMFWLSFSYCLGFKQ